MRSWQYLHKSDEILGLYGLDGGKGEQPFSAHLAAYYKHMSLCECDNHVAALENSCDPMYNVGYDDHRWLSPSLWD